MHWRAGLHGCALRTCALFTLCLATLCCCSGEAGIEVGGLSFPVQEGTVEPDTLGALGAGKAGPIGIALVQSLSFSSLQRGSAESTGLIGPKQPTTVVSAAKLETWEEAPLVAPEGEDTGEDRNNDVTNELSAEIAQLTSLVPEGLGLGSAELICAGVLPSISPARCLCDVQILYDNRDGELTGRVTSGWALAYEVASHACPDATGHNVTTIVTVNCNTLRTNLAAGPITLSGDKLTVPVRLDEEGPCGVTAIFGTLVVRRDGTALKVAFDSTRYGFTEWPVTVQSGALLGVLAPSAKRLSSTPTLASIGIAQSAIAKFAAAREERPTWFSGAGTITTSTKLATTSHPWLECLEKLQVGYDAGQDGEISANVTSLVSNGKKYKRTVRCFTEFDYELVEPKFEARSLQFSCSSVAFLNLPHNPVVYRSGVDYVLPLVLWYDPGDDCQTAVDEFELSPEALFLTIRRTGSTLKWSMEGSYPPFPPYPRDVAVKLTTGRLLDLSVQRPKGPTQYAVVQLLSPRSLPSSPPWIKCYQRLRLNFTAASAGKGRIRFAALNVSGAWNTKLSFKRKARCYYIDASGRRKMGNKTITYSCGSLRNWGGPHRSKLWTKKMMIPTFLKSVQGCEDGLAWEKNPFVYAVTIERLATRRLAMSISRTGKRKLPLRVLQGSLLGVRA